ncbi:MAG: Txe/YoeB family addiction module toxin [Pyrinomonadaceae bacterium]
MRTITFHADAFSQYNDWAASNENLFKRIQRLIIETARDPFTGIGKPEPLKGEFRGYWSRRINDEHRLVYKVNGDQLIIIACRWHYER